MPITAKNFMALLASLVGCALCAGEPVGYAVTMNHPDAMYRIGEKAVLKIAATNGVGEMVRSGVVDLAMDNYGSKKLGERRIDLAKENPFEVVLSLDEPGFARVQVAGCGWSKPFTWGVGFEPEKIVAAGEAPADFDEFWSRGIETLEKTVPLDPRMTLVPERSKGRFNFYRISFATFSDARVYGFLTIPKEAGPKNRFPVTVQVASAGKGKWGIDAQGLDDRIRMYFTVHSFDPPKTLDELYALHEKLEADLKKRYGVSSYSLAGLAEAPEKYYFYKVVLGINRAVDWLWRRPEVDRKRFGYEGGSQGGGFGWMLCGLNGKFTSTVLRVPALSDQRGPLVGRNASWPNAVGNPAFSEKDREAVVRNIAYFDGVSFAPRIKIPARVVVGLADNTCPPNSVYATFNRLGSSDKKILNGIGCGHGGRTRKYDALAKKWQYGL